MRVTFLGTGSAMPTGERFQTGIVVSEGDRRLLIDCGSGALQRLEAVGPGYEAISTVLLTHHHLDHVADLMPLIKARWLADEEAMTVVGPEGTGELVEGLFEVHEYMQDRIDLTVREVEAGTFEVGGFEVRARETRHSLPCLAYRFGDRFAFSGDSEAFADLAAFFDGVDVLAHDCSFPDDVDSSNHPTPSLLGEAFAEADAEVGRLYLTHLYPHTEGRHEEMLDSLSERYGGDVRVAEDGLSVSVGSVRSGD